MAGGMISWIVLGLNNYIVGAFLDLLQITLITIFLGYVLAFCFLLAIYYKKGVRSA